MMQFGDQNKMTLKPTEVQTFVLSFYRKGEAIPLQAWRGPEDSRRLKLPDFKIIGT